MFELLESALLSSAEAGLNRFIALDAASQRKLETLAGSLVLIESTRPRLSLYVLAHEQGLLLCTRGEGEADAVIRGPAAALVELMRGTEPPHSFYGRGIEVLGDPEKAGELQRLLAGLKIDWEYYLGRLLGDIPTQALSGALHSGLEFLEQSSRSLMMDLDEYLHEERRLFPGRNEADSFYSSLHALRLNVDRLAARVEQLAIRLDKR